MTTCLDSRHWLEVNTTDYSIRLDLASLNNDFIGTLFNDSLSVIQDHLVVEGNPVAIHLKVTQHECEIKI
jgi:hypothetical protein